MTKNEFVALCLKYTIDPAIALESDEVKQALRDQDAEEIERVLQEEF